MPTVIHQLADAFLRRKEAAQRKSVFPEDSFMPKSSKQDLANRLSVFEQGGTTELLKQAGKEMYENPVVNTAISLTPGAGDIQSGYEAYRSAREGNYGEAGLNALGVLPFVPALGGMVKESKYLENLNPTGSVFVKYEPTERATLPLGKNLTTLDKTMEIAPDEYVTIYRGVPHGAKDITPGDFITTNEQIAKDYAGNGKVISKRVPARSILDDITEPLGEEYIYRP